MGFLFKLYINVLFDYIVKDSKIFYSVIIKSLSGQFYAKTNCSKRPFNFSFFKKKLYVLKKTTKIKWQYDKLVKLSYFTWSNIYFLSPTICQIKQYLSKYIYSRLHLFLSNSSCCLFFLTKNELFLFIF